MNITKNTFGFWVVDDIIDNQLVTRRYAGYTKRQAIATFKAEFSPTALHDLVVGCGADYDEAVDFVNEVVEKMKQ